MVMTKENNKIAILTIRVHADTKEMLVKKAKSESRSMANMLEIIIRKYCNGENK